MTTVQEMMLAAFRHGGRIAVALAGAALCWGGSTPPDAGGYTATDSVAYSFVDVSTTGTGVLAGEDDAKTEVMLGFTFVFYGKPYASVCLSSNGLLTFGPCAREAVDFSNQDLTAAAVPGDLPAIAPFWTDLALNGGSVHYQTLGNQGARQFVAQWTSAMTAGGPQPVTFQAILCESSNEILMQYLNVDTGVDSPALNGGIATVGIQDGKGNASGKRVQWSHNARVLASAMALKFLPAAAPSSVAVVVNTDPGAMQVTVDGVAYTAPKTFEWAPGSNHTLSVPASVSASGTVRTFSAWSNSGPREQAIKAPSSPATYTASFTTQYWLTAKVNPVNAGSISGGGVYNAGASASVGATPAAGYTFLYFSGDLSGSANPGTVVMTGPKTVTANFGMVQPLLSASVAAKSGAAAARTWTIRLRNSGVGPANNAEITGVALTQTAGTACSPAVSLVTRFPVAAGSIAASTGTANVNVVLNFSGCAAGARFSAKVNFRANGGAYSGSTTISNQYQ